MSVRMVASAGAVCAPHTEITHLFCLSHKAMTSDISVGEKQKNFCLHDKIEKAVFGDFMYLPDMTNECVSASFHNVQRYRFPSNTE